MDTERERLADAIAGLSPEETAAFVAGMTFAMRLPAEMVLKMLVAPPPSNHFLPPRIA